MRDADRKHHDARTELADAGRLHRRTARHHVQDAAGELAAAKSTLDTVTERARPTLDQRNALWTERDNLQDNVTVNRRYLRDLNQLDQKFENARHTVNALDVWHDWAQGQNLAPQDLVRAAIDLHELDGQHGALARPLINWCHSHGWIQQQTIAPERDTSISRSRSRGIDIDF